MTTSAPVSIAALLAAGLNPTSTSAAATLLATASADLGCAPTCAWWVPGRIEVLGKHTDYAGGRVLNCATDLGLVIAAVPSREPLVTITSAGRHLELPLSAEAPQAQGWGTYASSVVRRLARHFPGLTTGARIAIAANLPAAAGMSSSSAVVIGIHQVIAHLNNIAERADYRAAISGNEDLVVYLGCHENGASFHGLSGDSGVGTAGGSQDHAAILLSRAGKLNDWSFNPFHRVDSALWPNNLELTVAVSGVAAEKTASAREQFNRVSQRARDAVAAWNRVSGRTDATLGAAVAAGGAVAVLAAMPNEDLKRRTEQFIVDATENIPAAVVALGANDLTRFGTLVARSHSLAETHLENQVPETRDLVRLAREHGAIAASAFGAGFGGAVWAAFAVGADQPANWLAAYRRLHPGQAQASSLHRVRPGPGCTPLHGAS